MQCVRTLVNVCTLLQEVLCRKCGLCKTGGRWKTSRWQQPASTLCWILHLTLFLPALAFFHHHPNQHHYPYYNLNIRTKILLNGVEWPLRAGLRGKNIAEIAQIENAGLRRTSKTLGRDNSPAWISSFLRFPRNKTLLSIKLSLLTQLTSGPSCPFESLVEMEMWSLHIGQTWKLLSWSVLSKMHVYPEDIISVPIFKNDIIWVLIHFEVT